MDKKKTIWCLLAMMLFLITISSALAGTISITQNGPANITWQTSSTTQFNVTVAGNSSSYSCEIHLAYTDGDISDMRNILNQTITNNTVTLIPRILDDINSSGRQWNLHCVGGDYDLWGSKNYTLLKDSNAPVLSSHIPSTLTYTPNADYTFQATVTDINYGECMVYINKSGTFAANGTNSSIVSGSAFKLNVNSLTDNVYKWGFWCNDTAGHVAWSGVNGTLVADSTAPTQTTISLPTNNTFSTVRLPTFNWSVVTEVYFSRYVLQIDNESMGFTSLIQNITLTNQSQVIYTLISSLLGDTAYWFRMTAFDLAGNEKNSTTGILTIDNTNPTLTLNQPEEDEWSNSLNLTFNWTAVDTNLDTCHFYVTNATSGGDANYVLNNSFTNVTSGTPYLYEHYFNADGLYNWSVTCNDSVNYNVTVGNRTINVDTTNPLGFSLESPANTSIGTDTTPTFKWNMTVDTNFNNYRILVSTEINLSQPLINESTTIKNTSTSSMTYISSTPLALDTTYHWSVTAYDDAGNIATPDNGTLNYTTIDSCSTLYDGWNLCGIIRAGSVNLSIICSEVGQSCEQVSIYNSSHSFRTMVSTSATNAGTTVVRGDAVWIEINTTSVNWENRTVDTATTLRQEHLTNASDIPWSIYGIQNRNGKSLGDIEVELDNSNVTYNISGTVYYQKMSSYGDNTTGRYNNDDVHYYVFFNNSASSGSKYVPHYRNWSFNNNTPLKFGEAVMISINSTTRNLGDWNYTWTRT